MTPIILGVRLMVMKDKALCEGTGDGEICGGLRAECRGQGWDWQQALRPGRACVTGSPLCGKLRVSLGIYSLLSFILK